MGSRQPGRALPFVRRKYRSRSWLLVGLLAFPLGVGASEDLPRAAPESLGISRAGLDRFVRELGTTVGARSVVVVHRGQVVTEAYWTGTASTLRHVRSVTKSVTSTLVGVAIDRGFIPDVEARMVDYLPTDLVPDDAAKDQIRLRHLLNHSAGFRWDENGEFSSWAGSANPLRFILERPLDSSPGSVFEYSTAATHVLPAVLDEATGSDVESFAALALLHPLGISDWRWEGDPLGYPFGGHGLELRTEDMAKLGVVFLDRGRWGARQVVAAEWIGTATAPHIEGTSSWGPVDNVSYGFLWWVADAGENRIFMAIGWGGQFVICAPALDLVVATNARWQVTAASADAQERAILTVVVDELLPLIPVRRRRPHRATGRARPVGDFAGGVKVDPRVWLR